MSSTRCCWAMRRAEGWSSGPPPPLLDDAQAPTERLPNCNSEPEERGQAALADLDMIRNEYPPDVEVYTDGSAAAGVRNGVGGVYIKWADGTPARRDCKAAGALASSTTAEAVGADLGLSIVEERLEEDTDSGHNTIWLLFDSRALHQRLAGSRADLADSTSAAATDRLRRLAQQHRVVVIWLPGHAGLHGNEQADRAAAAGRSLPQEGVALTIGAVATFLLEQSEELWRRRYRADPQATHLRLTDGTPLPTEGLTRAEASTLFNLCVNRAPFARATQARFGRAPSAECPNCDSGDQGTLHLLLECPEYATQRREVFGDPVEASRLRNPVAVVDYLRRAALI